MVELTTEIEDKLRSVLFGSVRELSGLVLSAIEETLVKFGDSKSTSFVNEWYRSAEIVSYESNAAAAAYLGAYAPRSILKYQEATFALLMMRGRLPDCLRVIDYGAGPCIGFMALVDLWDVLCQLMDKNLAIEYIAIDRSGYMLELGEELCRLISNGSKINASYELLNSTETTGKDANLLIIANVMNESEGNYDCRQLLSPLIHTIEGLEDVITIEPATEQPSRQMCGLGTSLTSIKHVGPCPSGGSNCSEWSFRQFNKRVYSFEHQCLGQWAPAARICKYSLSLLSSIAQPRLLPNGGYVIVSQPNISGLATICRFGNKQLARVSSHGVPWDIVDKSGKVIDRWP